MNCSECNIQLDANANFCNRCGSEVRLSLTCSNCDAVIDANANFCNRCGNKHKGSSVIPDQEHVELSSPEAEKLDPFNLIYEFMRSSIDLSQNDWDDLKKSEKLMKEVSPLLNDLADAHVGFPPKYISENENVIQFTFSNRWPKWFENFSDQKSKSSLKENFFILLELGLAYHFLMANWVIPGRTNPVSKINLQEIADIWLFDAYFADTIMENLYKDLYLMPGEDLLNWFESAHMNLFDFYKEYGVGMGFAGWNKGVLDGHRKMMFYSGARLGMIYDFALNGRLEEFKKQAIGDAFLIMRDKN